MQYYGTILSLDGFFGPIKIHGSVFTGNALKYSSCDLATSMNTATFSGTDNYSIFGTKSVLQIRSIISVTKHKHRFELVENSFTGNSGTKGIIFLDFYERANYPVYITGNVFTRNAGYIDSNVLYIRARGGASQDVYSLTPNSNANLFCTGYHFELNTFTNNMGCSTKAGGVIKFECLNSA